MATEPIERPPRERGPYSELARQRLIESRLTPNAISLTGFALCAVAAVVVAVLASLMVSYTRARAEALGVECKVGIADRAVRVVILSAGLLLSGMGLDVLEIAVYVLAVLSVVTVVQRIWHVRGELTRAAAAV